ncbi:condensation domain-containing protein [Actinophytocola gossypii]|uniref:Peptide synthase n=1 Tax=Actinophytocola gossypii TaxID=2812003 RepID=A0ABT2JGB9_9PSEU|nr:condensation domain-containing protein [Actinophytocola gossypii]MCT2586816.1 peptide synthase [Actinophytocola gossypii]
MEIPLSENQEWLCAFDKGYAEGAFGHRHLLVYGWRLLGEIDLEALRAALRDVVVRHEILRTALEPGVGGRHPVIHPPVDVPLTVRELPGDGSRDETTEDLLTDIEAGTYDVRELPHLRAVLGRFDSRDAVLVLVAHHIATDALSMQVIVRDLAACYAARTGRGDAPPAPATQYQDFARWQRNEAADPDVLAYWRDQLGGRSFTAIRTDRAGDGGDVTYAAHRFVLDAELTGRALALARARRCTPFIVSLAAYYLLLRRVTGETDLVAATTSAGRHDDRFTDTVGPFYYLLPLRADLTGARCLGDVVTAARATCLGAYMHDLTYRRIEREVPALGKPFADPSRAVVNFENLQPPEPMEGESVGGLRYQELRRRVRSQEITVDVPDGVLWAMELLPSGELAGTIKYSTGHFDRTTITALVETYRELLHELATNPDAPLD